MTERNTVGEIHEDLHLAGLIRQAGARERPSPAATATARAAVATEWRSMVAQRQRAQRRTQTLRWSAVAAALVAGLALWIGAPEMSLQPGASSIATLARVSGPVNVAAGGLFGGRSAGMAGAAIAQGSEIRSDAGGRAALNIGNVAVRMDEQSAIELLAADRIVLKRGAVYVDAGGKGGEGLVIETPYGEVRHLGTQYETRIDASALRVRVREGRVQVDGGGQAVEGAAGEQLLLRPDGDLQRSRVARSGGEWAWVEALAPEYDINDQPLIEFLRWVGRETGRDLVFGSPAAERTAGEMILRGSVKGMAPSQALAAVLMTTGLENGAQGEVLRIDLKTGER